MCRASSISPSPIATRPTRAEGDEADDEQDRRDLGDVEREHLHDQRGANIGAEHDRKRRHQADEALGREGTGDQRGGRAALEQRREPKAGGKGGETIVKRLGEQLPQVRPEGAQNPAVDHVQAPQQQRHATHQVEKNHGSHVWTASGLDSKDQAIGKLPPINPCFPESRGFAEG
jgi:hypothetical protein